jgi:hypothetical protein
MLAPFRAMIDAQLAAESTLRHHRGRAPRAPRPPRARPPSPLRGRLAEVLCVAGEANAWPRPAAGGVAAWPDEVVQWVAHRPATGETFEAIVAPGHPIAPATASHTGLDDATLRQGEALSAALQRWRAFLRDTDLVCAWGPYGTDLWQAAGAHLPPARLDLRVAARTDLHGKAGTPAEYLSRLGGHAEGLRPLGLGRAGTRVAQLAAIARCLAGPP